MFRNLLVNICTVSLLFIAIPTSAQLTVTTNANPLQLAQKILGNGVTIINPQFTGHALSAGMFKAVPGSFVLDSGIVLTTGKAKTAAGSFGVDAPGSSFATNNMSKAGDPDLNISGDGDPNDGIAFTTHDACILEFDFIPQGDSIYVRYVFASEEYPDFNCSNVNDVFAFFISGPGYLTKKNIALVPNAPSGATPVSINTVNNGVPAGNISNCIQWGIGSPFTQYYVDNSTGQYVVYDGRTVILTAKAKVIPCQTYHIKLAIADGGDFIYDSGVFLEASSFTSKKEIDTETEGPYADPANSNKITMIEGCKNAQVKLTRANGVTGAFSLVTSYSGTATPGVDFTSDLPSTVSFAANENQKIYNFTANVDALSEGLEKIVVRFSKGTCTSSFVDSAILFIRDSLVYRSTFDTSFCTISPITISSRDSVPNTTNSYLWSNGSTTKSITVTQPGSYVATHTYSERCFDIDSFNVVSTDPSISFANTNPEICPGDTAILSVTTNADTLTWSTGAHTDSIAVNTGGDYWVKATNASGCTKTDTVTVTIKPSPILNLGADTSLCDHDTLQLDAFYSGASYLWNTGAVSSSITVNSTGDYSVISSLNGCRAKDTIHVIVKPLPQINLGADTSICENTTMQLNAFYTGASYTWNTGATTATITVNDAGTYSVINTLNGCVSKDTINITTTPAPTVNLGADTSICENKSIVLDAYSAGATYTWNTGATSAVIAVSTAGNYSVLKALNGCTVSDSINIAVTPTPVVNLGNDTAICENKILLLNAYYPNANYEWSTGDVASSINVNTTGTYWVKNILNGCMDIDTINVAVTPAPFADLGRDTAMCDYDSIQLNASYPGANYTWSTGSSTSTITATIAGEYWVKVMLNGCTAEDTIVISPKKMPVANAGTDLLLPQNTTAQLNATVHSNNAAYLWSPASSLSDPSIPNPIVFPNVATEYTLQVISVDGCIAEDKVLVTIQYPLIIPNAFSPNGDNINDKWKITNIEFYPNSKVSVYNRYGQQVFFSNGYNNPWDGTSKGTPLPPATYYYIIETGNGNNFTGWIVLLR